MNKKLPVVATLKEAILLPFKHLGCVLKVGFPLILFFVLQFIISYFLLFDGGILRQSDDVFFAINLISLPLNVAALVIGVVGCHRIFLLDHARENTRLFNWTGNEIKVVGWWLVIGIAFLLMAIPFFLIFFVMGGFNIIARMGFAELAVTFLFFMPLLYIMVRWLLVIPSAAIGIHGKTLSWSWRLTAGNGFRLMLLVSIFPFLFNVLMVCIGVLFATIFSSLAYATLLQVLSTVLWLVMGVIQVALLSLSYKFLVENVVVEEDENDEPAEALAAQENGAS